MKHVKSRTHKPKKARVPGALTREGVVVVDPCFNLIAVDAGARAILNELAGKSDNGETPVALPSELRDLLNGRRVDGLATLNTRLSAGKSEYMCRWFALKQPNDANAESMLVLHLKREVSVIDTVHQVGRDYHLTDREQEALIGVAMGLTSKELAERMNVSPNTIKAFLRLIMLKMGASTRAGVVGKLLGQDGYVVRHASEAHEPQ
jgi:DNA-binding CsgD family transcriptional regulator